MVYYYENGIDLYIEAAKLFEPHLDFNDSDIYEEYRGNYKATLLAKFFNESDASLSARSGIPVEKAGKLTRDLRELYSVAFQWTDKIWENTVNSGGFVDTILGDIIDLSNEPSYRLKTQAANQAVQGFTALAIAAGVENIVWEAYKANMIMIPIISVHDSATKYFDIKDILKIQSCTIPTSTSF